MRLMRKFACRKPIVDLGYSYQQGFTLINVTETHSDRFGLNPTIPMPECLVITSSKWVSLASGSVLLESR